MTLPRLFKSVAVVAALGAAMVAPVNAASGLRPAPKGALADAPEEYTRFSGEEIARGFMALAFGSDLRIGSKKAGIHRFTRPVRVFIRSGGKPDRTAQMQKVLDEYAAKAPALELTRVEDAKDANIVVHLIDEADFAPALEEALGREVAASLIKKTDAQCMTNVASDLKGQIVHVESLIIVDQGDDVFFDCAYHELLHAFGLPGHDQSNPWTTLNQERAVGYLTVYDRTLLTLLYSQLLEPGMSPAAVRAALPRAIEAGSFDLEAPHKPR